MRTRNYHHGYLEGDFSLEATEKVEESLNLDDELELLKKEHSVLDEKILALEEIRFPSPDEQRHVLTRLTQTLQVTDDVLSGLCIPVVEAAREAVLRRAFTGEL